jgi:hypothetical protein
MTADLADSLAKRYISKLETSTHVCSIMDFFDSHKRPESLSALLKAPFTSVNLSYQTWDQYQQGVAHKAVAGRTLPT